MQSEDHFHWPTGRYPSFPCPLISILQCSLVLTKILRPNLAAKSRTLCSVKHECLNGGGCKRHTVHYNSDALPETTHVFSSSYVHSKIRRVSRTETLQVPCCKCRERILPSSQIQHNACIPTMHPTGAAANPTCHIPGIVPFDIPDLLHVPRFPAKAEHSRQLDCGGQQQMRPLAMLGLCRGTSNKCQRFLGGWGLVEGQYARCIALLTIRYIIPSSHYKSQRYSRNDRFFLLVCFLFSQSLD